MTDGFSDQYKQVLVTLYGIDVSTDNGMTWTTVYSDAAGQTIDHLHWHILGEPSVAAVRMSS